MIDEDYICKAEHWFICNRLERRIQRYKEAFTFRMIAVEQALLFEKLNHQQTAETLQMQLEDLSSHILRASLKSKKELVKFL